MRLEPPSFAPPPYSWLLALVAPTHLHSSPPRKGRWLPHRPTNALPNSSPLVRAFSFDPRLFSRAIGSRASAQ
jgi:hypothetical protein